MLRLAPTQIGIGSRDLTWHTERHEARQSRRANGYRVEVVGSPTKDLPETKERARFTLPCRFARPLSTRKTGFNSNPDVALISKEPVPRGSRIFWDSILAEAGTPSGIHVHNVGRRPRIVEQTGDSQRIVRSAKASIEEDFRAPTEAVYATLFDINCPQKGSTSEYASALEYGENNEEILAGNDFRGRSPQQFDLPIRSSSLISSGGSVKDSCAVNSAHLSQQRYLDDYPDSLPYHRTKWGSTSDEESEYKFTQYSAKSFRIRTATKSREELDIDTPKTTHITSEAATPFSSPQQPLPRSVDNFRRRSSLPRSPLYISQAAVSSSPEKHSQASKNSSEDDITKNTNLLAQPPRRRKIYKLQTERYPFDVSETSLTSFHGDDNDDLSIDEPSSNRSFISSPSPSTPEDRGSNHEASANSSSMPILRSSPTGYTSPCAFTPLRAPLPLPPLPPRPFSATARTTSFDFALPSSHISPTPSPSSVHNSSPLLTPRRIPVYNDRLPASSQPQTPARLPRNGLPPMFAHNQYGIGIGIQTAPPGNSRRRDSIGATTPTRRRGRTSEDQENLGVVVEMTRRLVMDRRRGERLRDLNGEEEDGGYEREE